MRGLLRRLRPGWARYSRGILVGVVLLVFVFTFYFWRLGSMTPGIGPEEYAARQNSPSSAYVFNHGINAPYYLFQHAVSKIIDYSSTFGLRLGSVLIALIVLISLYSLLRNWFGRNTALCALLIFSSTPWLVLTARTAGADIMYFWPIVMLAIFYKWLKSGKSIQYHWLLLCVTVAVGVYTPGVIWLVLVAIILLRTVIRVHIKRTNLPFLLGGILVGLILLVPLVQALVSEPTRIKMLFLIPVHWPQGMEILASIGWSAWSLVWRLRSMIDISIDRLGVFNIFQLTLAIFGIYALLNRARRLTYSLVGLLAFVVLIAGLNQNPHLLSLGLLAVVVFITAGLRFLYIEWRRVFPLNPFAKALALGLILIVLAAHVLYSARYSLIAWPHTEATRSSYVLK